LNQLGSNIAIIAVWDLFEKNIGREIRISGVFFGSFSKKEIISQNGEKCHSAVVYIFSYL
jgi:hypothetical protein